MALIERLMKLETPGIPVHAFMAAAGEWERGKMTRAEFIAAFGITPAEEAELDALAARVRPPRESYSFGGYTVLTNIGTNYDNTDQTNGLGFVTIEASGITALRLDVRVRKVGTGTQEWQLWDETGAGSEVLVIADSGGAGTKLLTNTLTFGAPLNPGLKTVRLRARSSTGSDDPVYLGASLIVERVDVLTAEVLHEVLLLGEERIPPYNTAAAVRTRLRI